VIDLGGNLFSAVLEENWSLPILGQTRLNSQETPDENGVFSMLYSFIGLVNVRKCRFSGNCV